LTETKDEKRFRTIDAILAFAIKKEEEAAAAYGEMLEAAGTPGLKKLLKELYDEEGNHKRLLEKAVRAGIEELKSKSVEDLRITDYLIAEPPHPDMSFQDLLIFAARKEHKAAQLYSALALRLTKEGHRKLFEFLAGQEKTHKLRLESEYERHVLGED
jgi:rubrerythrin